MVAREGSESGPLIDFVNELADGVRDRYPEVRVMTAAYWWGMVPPKTLRPRDNVIIHWCNWYGFPGSNIPEPWQPLSSAVNAVRAENLRQWSAIAPGGLLIVEYGDCYTWPGFPFTSAPLLADNIRFLADNHAVGLWLHSEMHMPWEVNNERRGAEFFAYANGQFSPLYYWLAMQLMLDPRQPVEPLIATFMAGYYGPAAPTMRSLYDKLVAAQRALPARGQRGPWDNIAKADYVTPAFFAEVDALLEKAEAACAPDSPELRHVQYERLRSDSSLLSAWAKLKTRLAPGAAMPFDREAVITRIETRAWPVMEALGYPEKAKGGGLYSAFGGGSLDNRIKNWRADSGQGQAPEAASQKVPGLPPVGPELSIAPVAGRYVRIERRNQYLCIAEVQVSSGGQNVALRKKATQSSLSEWGGSPERAVDGNTSGNWADGSVTHTRNGPNEWWEVDLGQNCPIESIAYYDRANHQSDWVPGTDVIILDENRKVVWRRTIETRLDGKGDRIVF